jgi:hypothetical protein
MRGITVEEPEIAIVPLNAFWSAALEQDVLIRNIRVISTIFVGTIKLPNLSFTLLSLAPHKTFSRYVLPLILMHFKQNCGQMLQ